jgi:hypothetical protein
VLKASLSIQKVYKKDTKIGKRNKKEKTPAKPKNRRKPNTPTGTAHKTQRPLHHSKGTFTFAQSRTKTPTIIISRYYDYEPPPCFKLLGFKHMHTP